MSHKVMWVWDEAVGGGVGVGVVWGIVVETAERGVIRFMTTQSQSILRTCLQDRPERPSLVSLARSKASSHTVRPSGAGQIGCSPGHAKELA